VPWLSRHRPLERHETLDEADVAHLWRGCFLGVLAWQRLGLLTRPSQTVGPITPSFMNLAKSSVLSLLVATTLLAADSGGPSEKDLKKLKEQVPTTIENFKKADSTLGDFFTKSVGYAVLPRVRKGGLHHRRSPGNRPGV